jgi:hypothetical protein
MSEADPKSQDEQMLTVMAHFSGSPEEVRAAKERVVSLLSDVGGFAVDVTVGPGDIEQAEVEHLQPYLDTTLDVFLSRERNIAMHTRSVNFTKRSGLLNVRHLLIMGREAVSKTHGIHTGSIDFIDQEFKSRFGTTSYWHQDVASMKYAARLCDRFSQIPILYLTTSHIGALLKAYNNLAEIDRTSHAELAATLQAHGVVGEAQEQARKIHGQINELKKDFQQAHKPEEPAA